MLFSRSSSSLPFNVHTPQGSVLDAFSPGAPYNPPSTHLVSRATHAWMTAYQHLQPLHFQICTPSFCCPLDISNQVWYKHFQCCLSDTRSSSFCFFFCAPHAFSVLRCSPNCSSHKTASHLFIFHSRFLHPINVSGDHDWKNLQVGQLCFWIMQEACVDKTFPSTPERTWGLVHGRTSSWIRSVKVEYPYLNTIVFSKYETYFWAEISEVI